MATNVKELWEKNHQEIAKRYPSATPEELYAQTQIVFINTISKRFGLVLDTKGNPKMCDENIVKIMAEDDMYAERVRYNVFMQKIEYRQKDVWEGIGDVFAVDVMCYIQRTYSPFFSGVPRGKVQDAILAFAFSKKVNPIQDWVKSLVWDKQPRIDTWLTTVYGADNDEYHNCVGANFMKALVKRITSPGCKVDHVMVLEGKQGAGKSSSLSVLGMGYHVETTINTDNKDFFMIMRGKTIVEFSEGEILSKASMNQLKSIITTQIDTFRPPYGREQVDFPRGCIFAMTTNSASYLRDETGNRRWLPVECKKGVDMEWLRENREQMYAEAYYRLETLNEEWWKIPQEVAEEKQESRMEHSDYLEPAIEWLHTKNGHDWRTAGVDSRKFIIDVIYKGFQSAKWDRRDEMTASNVFRRDLKLERRQSRNRGGARVWRYFPTEKTPHWEGSMESIIINTDEIERTW